MSDRPTKAVCENEECGWEFTVPKFGPVGRYCSQACRVRVLYLTTPARWYSERKKAARS